MSMIFGFEIEPSDLVIAEPGPERRVCYDNKHEAGDEDERYCGECGNAFFDEQKHELIYKPAYKVLEAAITGYAIPSVIPDDFDDDDDYDADEDTIESWFYDCLVSDQISLDNGLSFALTDDYNGTAMLGYACEAPVTIEELQEALAKVTELREKLGLTHRGIALHGTEE